MQNNCADRATTWDFPPGSQPLPLVIAHRGDLSRAPENTIPAFRRAMEAGADGVELDVRLTKDSQLVVFHDRNLDRTSNGKGPVNQSTLAEIRSLDVGSWFSPKFQGETAPTLDEVFESLPPDYLINVEMKVVIRGAKQIARLVADTIRRHSRWATTMVASFNPLALYHLRRLDPRIYRGYIWSKRHPFPIRSRCFSPKLHRSIRRRGVRMLAWDLDFHRDMQAMASARLDATVTDALTQMIERKRTLSQQLS